MTLYRLATIDKRNTAILCESDRHIVIAHRLSTIRKANLILFIENGRLVERGTHEELMRKQGIYYGLVMAQRQMSKMPVKNQIKPAS